MIFLNIGSNLISGYGSRFKNIYKCLKLLKKKNIKITKISSFYETPSYPNKNFPKFINVGVLSKYKKKVEDLLNDILSIENEMGRKRTQRNEPRIIDIDIIDFNKETLISENLIIPHKSIKIRNFVLYPLQEIDPEWSHPITGEKIDILIRNLDYKMRNEITRINESDIINL